MKRKNKWLLALTCAVTAMGTSLFAGCKGSYKMTGFIVERPAITSYTVGDTVDFSALVMYATFSDDTTQSIPLDRVKIYLDGVEITDLSLITKAEGTFKVGFKYSDIVQEFEFTVNPQRTAAELSKVTMDSANVVKTYEVGATDVSLDGLVLTAHFSDQTSQTVLLSDPDIKVYCNDVEVTGNLNKIAEKKGTQTVKVAYKSMQAEGFINVEITNPITGISLNKENATTVYKVGDTVDFSALAVTATYKDQTTSAVALTDVKYYVGETELTQLNTLTEKAGEKTVTVSYQEKTADFTVTVNNFVTEVAVDTTGVTLDYVEDGEISVTDFANVKVNVTYADQTDETADKELSLTDNGVTCQYEGAVIVWENLTLTAGAKVITVSYGGKSATFTVNVAQGDTIVETLSVVSEPTVKTFTAGGNVSLDGLSIKATYKAGYSETEETIPFAEFANKGVKLIVGTNDVTSDLNAIAKVETLGENTVTVQVKYGKTATFEVKVTNSVKEFTLDTKNVKTAYKVKDKANFDGIAATAVCDFGTKTLAVSDLKFFDGANELVNGSTVFTAPTAEKTVTVKYEGKEATFKISVEDWIESLAVSGTTAFECDYNAESIAFDGLVVTATYASGESKDVTAQAAIAYKDILKTPGQHAVSVTFEGKNAEISLYVHDILVSIEILGGAPTMLTYNGVVNFKDIRLEGTYESTAKKSLTIVGTDNEFLRDQVAFELKDTDGNWVEITNDLSVITSVAGERVVRVAYTERGKTFYKEFIITVSEPLPEVSTYSEPLALTQYKAKVASATNDVTHTNFENEFFKNDVEDYLVGDDNEFLFLPVLSQLNIETGSLATLQAFKATTTITVQLEDGGEFATLVKTPNGNNYDYSYNNVVYVQEIYGSNEYKFVENVATGLRFTITVVPDKAYFDYEDGDFSPVSCAFKVIDGYNVDDSKELCLLEQTDNTPEEEGGRRADWDEIKANLGLTGVRPNAIILHKDMLITTDSIPKSFYYTLDSTYSIVYKYTDPATGQEKTCSPEEVPASMGGPLTRDFIWNHYHGNWGLFEYWMREGESFAIHGNYFNLDASKLPLVASFEPNGVTVPGGMMNMYYEGDFSNVSLLEVHGVDETTGEADEKFDFSNFAVKGNAMNAPLYTSMGSYEGPVYGGGLIFVKMLSMEAKVDNVRANNSFIAYYTDHLSNVTYTRAKAYDGFQNAIYSWGKANSKLINCHMKRAAGPLILMQESYEDGDKNQPKTPTIDIDASCDLESYVTGQEQWFASVGASAYLTTILTTDGLLQGYYQKTFKNPTKNGMINMIAVTLNSEALSGITHVATQTKVTYGTSKLDRMWTLPAPYLNPMVTLMGALNKAGAAQPVTFNVGDHYCGVLTPDGVEPSLVTIPDMTAPSLANVATVPTLYNEFKNGDYKCVTLNVGSIGIMMEYFSLT